MAPYIYSIPADHPVIKKFNSPTRGLSKVSEQAREQSEQAKQAYQSGALRSKGAE